MRDRSLHVDGAVLARHTERAQSGQNLLGEAPAADVDVERLNGAASGVNGPVAMFERHIVLVEARAPLGKPICDGAHVVAADVAERRVDDLNLARDFLGSPHAASVARRADKT